MTAVLLTAEKASENDWVGVVGFGIFMAFCAFLIWVAAKY